MPPHRRRHFPSHERIGGDDIIIVHCINSGSKRAVKPCLNFNSLMFFPPPSRLLRFSKWVTCKMLSILRLSFLCLSLSFGSFFVPPLLLVMFLRTTNCVMFRGGGGMKRERERERERGERERRERGCCCSVWLFSRASLGH